MEREQAGHRDMARRHPALLPSHKLPSPLAGDLGRSGKMANSTQGPSAELWASHKRMLMEPLESNDPEVRALFCPCPAAALFIPQTAVGMPTSSSQACGREMVQGWWDPSMLYVLAEGGHSPTICK